MLTAFLPVALLLGAGVALRAGGVLPAEAAGTLHALVLRVCLPATILVRVPGLVQSAPSEVWVALVPWALAGAALAVVTALGRLLGWPHDVTRALVLTVGLGNTSFLGYPVVRATLGEAALGTAVVLDQLGSFLVLTTLGTFVARREREPAAMARKVLVFPPFVALVVAAGLGLAGRALPGPLQEGAELASGAMVPLVLLALGLGLRVALPEGVRAPLAAGLLLKLVIVPAAVLGVLRLLDLRGAAAQVALLESAMPPMVTAAALAESEGLAPELARGMAGLGLVVSLATLPLVVWAAERWL